ncbi:uncharacterized protein RAG0_10853 [Rhynchosporium agropyri]|uniref:Uncharacterized protein n=1 Tax=Rhynchosporium agropyri TaxID=914238 RepID=A0A1E1L1I1_9HELO|nr:uncharacterized protein RAG0_10853 [Rhynchosporium agropyri]
MYAALKLPRPTSMPRRQPMPSTSSAPQTGRVLSNPSSHRLPLASSAPTSSASSDTDSASTIKMSAAPQTIAYTAPLNIVAPQPIRHGRVSVQNLERNAKSSEGIVSPIQSCPGVVDNTTRHADTKDDQLHRPELRESIDQLYHYVERHNFKCWNDSPLGKSNLYRSIRSGFLDPNDVAKSPNRDLLEGSTPDRDDSSSGLTLEIGRGFEVRRPGVIENSSNRDLLVGSTPYQSGQYRGIGLEHKGKWFGILDPTVVQNSRNRELLQDSTPDSDESLSGSTRH